jgi:hypothetical protein
MKFSQRIGKNPIKTDLQINSMDENLRVGLWNVFRGFFLEQTKTEHVEKSPLAPFFNALQNNFLKDALDNISNDIQKTSRSIMRWFFACNWYEVYDFIEFVSQFKDIPLDIEMFKKECNRVLEKECSGYRFLGNHIVPISDDVEIKEIEDVIRRSQKANINEIITLIKSALQRLSKRRGPDNRGSIRDSINAVKVLCRHVCGDKEVTISQALARIENKVILHAALKRGINALYGHMETIESLEDAKFLEPKADLEDAKCMLVFSCTFINYIIRKAEKAGLELNSSSLSD